VRKIYYYARWSKIGVIADLHVDQRLIMYIIIRIMLIVRINNHVRDLMDLMGLDLVCRYGKHGRLSLID
jgi:hypothetical protein